MEVSQMNKTAILSFIIDEVVLKARNVSINMRKRIHWMLTLKEITVRKYDARALILNGWVRVRKEGVYISEVEDIKKGVSNYNLETQEQLDKLKTLNKKVRCYSLDFKLTNPIEVESIQYLYIDQDKYDIYSKCSFNTVKHLQLNKLSTDQIKFILTRCKRIDRLRISNCSLQKLDLTQFRIKQLHFDYNSFKEPIYLPKQIEKLVLMDCESPNLIKAQKVSRICLNRDSSKEYEELIKSLKGVKVAAITDSLEQCLTLLPSTIRKIDGLCNREDNLGAIINQFPYLIQVTPSFPIQITDKSKLRVIEPRLEKTKEKFNLRPRKITVTSNNAIQLNNHPELFEKVEWVYIESNQFNLDVLPSKIKRIQIRSRMDLESMILNRVEKECG